MKLGLQPARNCSSVRCVDCFDVPELSLVVVHDVLEPEMHRDKEHEEIFHELRFGLCVRIVVDVLHEHPFCIGHVGDEVIFLVTWYERSVLPFLTEL